MPDWLMIWGAGQVAAIVFRPILEDLARDVAKDGLLPAATLLCFEGIMS